MKKRDGNCNEGTGERRRRGIEDGVVLLDDLVHFHCFLAKPQVHE